MQTPTDHLEAFIFYFLEIFVNAMGLKLWYTTLMKTHSLRTC